MAQMVLALALALLIGCLPEEEPTRSRLDPGVRRTGPISKRESRTTVTGSLRPGGRIGSRLARRPRSKPT